MPYEEKSDAMDIVEGKSATFGHSSDIGGAGQSIAKDYVPVPPVDEGDTVTSLTVTDRSMQGQSFPGMKMSSVLLTKVESEVMRSCPRGDVCQHDNIRITMCVG